MRCLELILTVLLGVVFAVPRTVSSQEHTFRSPYYQGIQGDTLLIHDFRLNCTTRMTIDGSLIDVLLRPRLPSRADRYQLSEDRQLLLHQVQIYEEKYMVQKAALTIVDAGYDTLTHVVTDSVVVGIYGYNPGSESGQTYWLPQFPSSACYAYSDTRGAFLTNGQASVIHHYSNEGELVEQIVLDIPPTPVTREERRAIIADINRRIQERTGLQR